MEEIFNHLREMEVALHQQEIRTNVEQLKLMLHPKFIEIGYSGKTHDYSSTLKNLISEKISDFKVWSQDYKYTEFSKTIIQLTYKAAQQDKYGNLSRHAKRSSIWVNESGEWKVKFHQGTPTDAFEKSNI